MGQGSAAEHISILTTVIAFDSILIAFLAATVVMLCVAPERLERIIRTVRRVTGAA